MLNLLEKFGQVEIKEDDRISDADRHFCAVHQEAYEKAREGLKNIAEQFSALEQGQKDILSPVAKYTDTYISDTASKIYDMLDHTHGSFIVAIVSYFRGRYHVEIKCDKIAEALLPKKPEYGWRCEYEKEKEDYTQCIRDLTLNYKDILGQIFVQLDGYSFQDKAIKELKDAAHKAAWSRANGKKLYAQKKAVISFPTYACHFNTFFHSVHFRLTDDIKAVVKALDHFEWGVVDSHSWMSSQLLGYSFEESVFDFEQPKVKQVKCFKNGRVDIRFTSEAYARKFAEDYLGTENCA